MPSIQRIWLGPEGFGTKRSVVQMIDPEVRNISTADSSRADHGEL